MKKCSRCQAENFDDQKFCNLCGKELTPRVTLDPYAGVAPSAMPAPAGPASGATEGKAYEHFLKAREHIGRRDLDAAIVEFEHALAICPSDPMIQRLLAKTLDARQRASGEHRVRAGASPSATADASPARSRKTDPDAARAQAARSAAPSARSGPARSGSGSTLRSAPACASHAPRASLDFSIGGLTPGKAVPHVPLGDDPGQPLHRPDEPRHAAPERAVPDHGPARGDSARATPGSSDGGRTGGGAGRPAAAATSGRSRSTRPEPAAPAESSRPASHTGRFLELYTKTPALSPALVLDARDETMREIGVNLLILAGFLAFGFLLLL